MTVCTRSHLRGNLQGMSECIIDSLSSHCIVKTLPFPGLPTLLSNTDFVLVSTPGPLHFMSYHQLLRNILYNPFCFVTLSIRKTDRGQRYTLYHHLSNQAIPRHQHHQHRHLRILSSSSRQRADF
ncbi:hypothetical protein JAAARDRAFT_529641 [Jaapia argillacea MUCL 33604]|uniref:Uncharacterized protein n=1 Tax=Jaapia argillacea MUCL 33604 TaxID=933084 RepID=A0A067P929_9AGAM|nr:hypothetical protein JAAARDRAFT_529641 [Jaapia argillacea MUCL 33604]